MTTLLHYLAMAALIAGVLAATGCTSNKIYRIFEPEKCVKAIDGRWVCESEED